MATACQQQLADLYQQHSRQLLATLIRLLGDFDRAEDALQEALSAALQQWPEQGIPQNPLAWLISAGRFKAIDKMRQQRRFVALDPELFSQPETDVWPQLCQALVDDADPALQSELWPDDYLRLIFTCCHPALAVEAQLALTLREVCGLTTEQIARAFLQTAPTLAQRIVRAKQKIKAAAIPYQIPPPQQLPERLQAVHKVIYLLFNEGYSYPQFSQPQHSSVDQTPLAPNLCEQAIQLARQLLLLHFDAESCGLLALLLLQHARRHARHCPQGKIVLLAAQDRSLWEQAMINEGLQLTEQALTVGRIGPYGLQAAIAALHAQSRDSASTDWPQIAALYQVLYRLEPSAVVALNQAVAQGMCQGPAVALTLLQPLAALPELKHYHLLYAIRADFYRQLGQMTQAKADYRQALSLTQNPAEQQFLQQRLTELASCP
jgi:RNA polymerase sigma-70 factor (ECF subfamily)